MLPRFGARVVWADLRPARNFFVGDREKLVSLSGPTFCHRNFLCSPVFTRLRSQLKQEDLPMTKLLKLNPIIRISFGIFAGAFLIFVATAFPAAAQEPIQQQDRVQSQDQDRLQTQDRLLTQDRDRLREQVRDLEKQQKQNRDQVRAAEKQYGKNSTQAQEARQQQSQTREQIRSAKKEMKQVQSQIKDQQRAQERQRIHEPGTGLGEPRMGSGQRGGFGSSGSGSGSQGGSRGGGSRGGRGGPGF
jgi:hypothetical protein